MLPLDIHLSAPLHDSFRVRQISGLFDLPIPARSETHLRAMLLDENDPNHPWQIGAIIGPSGSGKTTLARHAYPGALHKPQPWPADRAVIDCFPADLPIKHITRTLTAVGFSSPSSWLKPHAVLSTGEKFRAELARSLLSKISCASERDTETGRHGHKEKTQPALPPDSLSPGLPVSLSFPILTFDEFTTPLDRTTAHISARALAKSIRNGNLPVRFVAVTCYADILPHLSPDWILDTATMTLTTDRPPQPAIDLVIRPGSRAHWPLFQRHHYLAHALHPAARCFVGYVGGRPATFTAVLPFPHPRRPGWREHRTVCLPDYQGIGLGSAASDYVASLFITTGKPYFSRTSHPAMIHHRLNSPDWKLLRTPGMVSRSSPSSLDKTRMSATISRGRNTAGFEYVGTPRTDDARRFGILRDVPNTDLSTTKE